MMKSIIANFRDSTCICSGIKTSYLSQLGNRTDFTWATYDIFAWVTAEFFLVIVCGSIPTLRPLLNFFRRQLGVTPKYSGTSYQRHTGDSDVHHDDTIELRGFRKDCVISETTVSNSDVGTHAGRGRKSKDVVPGDDIRIEKTFRVQVSKSESEQELRI